MPLRSAPFKEICLPSYGQTQVSLFFLWLWEGGYKDGRERDWRISCFLFLIRSTGAVRFFLLRRSYYCRVQVLLTCDTTRRSDHHLFIDAVLFNKIVCCWASQLVFTSLFVLSFSEREHDKKKMFENKYYITSMVACQAHCRYRGALWDCLSISDCIKMMQ